jgi:hemerythrin-like metal-binding protein
MDIATRSRALRIGVRLLDCDHRELSETIDEIQEAVVRDADRRRPDQLLRKLAKLTRNHFALEEGMMAATRYPGIALHLLNHQLMMDQLKALAFDDNRCRLPLNPESLSFLSELHITHVRKDDLKFGYWLNEVAEI